MRKQDALEWATQSDEESVAKASLSALKEANLISHIALNSQVMLSIGCQVPQAPLVWTEYNLKASSCVLRRTNAVFRARTARMIDRPEQKDAATEVAGEAKAACEMDAW